MEILAFLLAIGALVWASMNRSAAQELEKKQLQVQKEVARLQNALNKLTSKVENVRGATSTETAPPESVQPKPSVTAPPPQAPLPKPVEPAPAPHPPMPVPPPRPAAQQPSLPSSQPRPAAIPVASKPAFDWEALVGVKLFSWIAGIALVFAAVFFLKYSVDHGWLSPPIRMAIGLVTGAGLLTLCEWKAARRYAVTANALDAAGIAILFSTFFAAHALWDLIAVVPTFGLMALVTAVAVLLSVRHDSLFVALLGLVGGFATPALLSTGEDRPLGLFSYLLLLNAGLAWVAYQKRWPYLTLLSTVFTTIYQWGWVLKFLDGERIPLALAIFLIFPILSFVALALGERRDPAIAGGSLFQQASAVGVGLPVLFALYMAAVPAYGGRYWFLFGFLFLVDAGLAAIAAKRGPEVLHLCGGFGTVLVFLMWLQLSYNSSTWPAFLAITAVFVLFYTACGYGVPFKDVGRQGAIVAPLLLVVFPVLASIEPASASPVMLFGVLFALMTAIAAYAVARGKSGTHFLAALFVVGAEAVWSVKYLDSERLFSALVLYTILGLFFLAVPLLADRWRREEPGDSGVFGPSVYLALTGHVFLFLVASQATLSIPPWPFLAVLAVLDLAIGVVALCARRSELHLLALAVSQVILIVWQLTVATAPWPATAILGAMAIAAMAFAWFLLGRRLNIPVAEPAGAWLAAASVLASLLGMGVVGIATTLPGAPGVLLLATASAVFLCFILAIAALAHWHALAPLSVVPPALVLFVWSVVRFTSANWSEELLFASVIYALFLAYPLLMESRAAKLMEPYLAAVMASVPFFLSARHSLLAGGFAGQIGLLPVVQAALLGVLLWRLVRIEPPGQRARGRLALVAGAVLAFVTVAIPLQLEKEWITIGWALQAVALAWLFQRIPHRGLVIWTSGLMAVVFVRLALNPAVLTYYPRSATPIFNWYLYTYLVAAAAFFAVAWLLRDDGPLGDGIPRITPLAASGGAVFLFLLLNIEIADYYSIGSSLAFNFNAGLAQDLTYTIGWGLFAFGLLIAGILLSSKPARVSAILLLSLTVGKCFLHDLWRLGGLYRIGSFVGLAVCLTLVALLLQKFVLRAQSEVE